MINTVNWDYLNHLPINEAYENFNEKLQAIIDEVAPQKQVTSRNKYIKRDPWMTRGLLHSSHNLQKLYRKQINRDKAHEKHIHYVKYRNLYNKLKRQAKQEYYKNLLDQYKGDIKKTWQVLNTVIGKTTDKSNAAQIFLINDKKIDDPLQIANSFGKFFSQVGKECDTKIPTTDKAPQSYLKNRSNASMFMTPTYPQELLHIISKLKTKNSSGIDRLSSKLIKCIPSITDPLCILINKSLQEGIMPDLLKIAKVQPIFKSKNKEVLSNYRPISILPTISKIFEKVIFKRTLLFLNSQNVIYKKQYGFRPRHSTTDAIIDFTQNVYETYEKKEHGLGVFLDLTKAFDTINHKILLRKLEWYGIRGKTLEWFTSYLSNRKLLVNYNNTESELYDITYGVPQGSILGPLLFILYINDLPHALTHSSPILFADDTSLYLSHTSLKEVTSRANIDLELLYEWFKANRLSLNIPKTQYIHFTMRDLKIHTDKTGYIQIGGNTIEQKETLRFLGMHIDSLLDWKHHIIHIKNKLYSGIYAMNRIKNYLPLKYMKTLYYTLIQSHIDYGLILYGNANKKYITKLQTLQNKAIRIISTKAQNSSIISLYRKLRILKVKEQYKLFVGKFMYRFKTETLPNAIQNLYQTNREFHNYNTRNRYNLATKKHRLHKTNKSLMNMGPKIWNNLPNTIKNAQTFNNFKYQLKNYLQES